MDSSAPFENHPGEVPRSHKRALLLGVDRYGADIPPLRNAVRDVQVIGDVLRTAQGFVRFLCQQLGVPIDRVHIKGHCEAAKTTHEDCPNRIWDWGFYMGLLTSGTSHG